VTRHDAVQSLRALLSARGVSDDVFAAALEEDRLDTLVVETLVGGASELHRAEELADSTGISMEQAGRLWRALGFAEVGEGASFTDRDLDALRTIRGLADLGVVSPETSVQVTRVLGSSMARLADALVSAEDAHVAEQPVAWAEPGDDGLVLATALAFTAELVLPGVEDLVLYAWRRHLLAALRRRVAARRAGDASAGFVSRLTVGFADMVGFTALSSQLPAEQLARVVDRFEDLAHTTVVSGGGRAVKMIGDEVMFVAADPLVAVAIALDLADAYADDELLSDVRVGLAEGPVLTREGDFFGAVVNRAARMVAIADAGTVLVDDGVRRALEGRVEEDVYEWEALTPRELKDIGRVELWRVARAGRLAVSEERRAGRRWRRLSGIAVSLQGARPLPPLGGEG